jgi:hypothetical protein
MCVANSQTLTCAAACLCCILSHRFCTFETCSSASLSTLLAALSKQPKLQHSSTTYCYSDDEQQQLQCKHQEQQEADSRQLFETLDVVSTCWDAVESSTRSSSSSRGTGAPADEAAAGDTGATAESANLAATDSDGYVTLWFPHGGVYARLPVQLPGAEGTNNAVTFEVGALHE